MSGVEQLRQSRELVRHQISEFPQILEGEPNTWWKATARLLLGFRQQLQVYPDLEVREYFGTQIEGLFKQLRSASILTPSGRDDFASLADHIIMNFSMEIAASFEQKEFPQKTCFLPLGEMIKNQPDRFKTENRLIKGEECIILRVKHPTQDNWQEIPLPKNRKVWHKGGPARAVLDIVAHAPFSMQENEFPWNDYDALVANSRKNKKAAINIGVDVDGIEYMGENELNFPRYCAGRDTTQNQVCLGSEGLYYSQNALTTAITGHTRIENEYVANKAIYGFDRMTIQGESLAKPRGMMRLIKAVVEGKALSFDYIQLNSLFDLGTHSLFLAKRWSKKDRFPEYLQRMFYLLKQMHQTKDGENDMFDTLERAHSEYPFFDFDSEVRFPIEVVRWKARKLIKQIDREMGWQFSIPTDMEIERVPGDSIPTRISLEGFVLKTDQLNVGRRWNEFMKRSEQRNKTYQAQDLSPYEKIFNQGSSDTDGLGVDNDDLVSFGNDDL
ncbi:MAG: hypothetical protein UW41_C0002G0102 [Candidatus Collierbacteria bacterium GW2011_GWC2_44_18]|uniref:Uncharacterized protein n=2 Tax=Microgenomates group TaxID=1794810 RepID=A0A0G1LFD6_9BACT|nr:MAG: hypothetical protein UW41_C0002G0102 [Candidatus Collierbacteria bacterium GW2011_GWC2_44_18]KKT67392.1 MAG: hypothetical protein UW60_C0007G0006 [Candidatus Woesebacteria bacterium GW2011_GWA2_44_33]